LKLSNFEKYVDDVILERGMQYFHQGHVETIDEIDKNQFLIEVEGSEYYTVEINLTAPAMFVETYCNCPYDWGEYCKHQVAALFALRRDRELETEGRKSDLKTIVSNLTKTELIHIIMNLSKMYPEIRRELKSAFLWLKDENSNSKDI
jgi:uncharacterized Zn finger protein